MRRMIVCLVVAVATVPAAVASATIRNVPADHATIQAAINASVNGDTVIVGPGTYFENLDFGVKTIRLISSSGSTVTILKPNAATPAKSRTTRSRARSSSRRFSGSPTASSTRTPARRSACRARPRTTASCRASCWPMTSTRTCRSTCRRRRASASAASTTR